MIGRVLGPYEVTATLGDVMLDGRTFVMIRRFSEPLATLRLVQHWWTEIQAASETPGG